MRKRTCYVRTYRIYGRTKYRHHGTQLPAAKKGLGLALPYNSWRKTLSPPHVTSNSSVPKITHPGRNRTSRLSTTLSSAVHELACQGFNLQTSAYEAARPSYPPAILTHLTERALTFLSAHPTAQSVYLTARTGKFTRPLVPFGLGRLGAVEPSAGMRAKFKEMVLGVDIVDGTSTHIPVCRCHIYGSCGRAGVSVVRNARYTARDWAGVATGRWMRAVSCLAMKSDGR
ncbi:hypothetical protein DFJ77DRAFT_237371 [Powellomyces hirtus]|nr:hypothetical protein DFJ77DRAFT_237371 [Powellomyces hirtus]